MAKFASVALLSSLAASQDDFLPNWMGKVSSVIGKQPFLGLTLPGTHDTMTYDLSTTIAAGGIDDHPDLSKLLNDFGDIPEIGDYIRDQAVTQRLTVTEQLDAGVRFLDFRIMYSGGAWRNLHCVQSNGLAADHLKEVRTWMDAHPTEVVAIWTSKHGSQCNTGNKQYPGVSIETKQAFFKEITQVFNGILLDTAQSNITSTALSDLVKRNHRVVLFASDFKEFTGGQTTLAMDGCNVDNDSGRSGWGSLSLKADLAQWATFHDRRAQDNPKGMLYLMSSANSPPSPQMTDALKIRFLPGGTSNIADCAKSFNVTGFENWCPERLIDIAQMLNYYKQQTIEHAYQQGFEFPNAVYIDAVAPGGLIRTGTQPLSHKDGDIVCDIYTWSSCQTHKPTCDQGWTANGDHAHNNVYDYKGSEHTFCGLAWQNHYKCCRDEDGTHATDGYAYADTLIASTVRRACKVTPSADCNSTMALMESRRALHPMKVWDDALTGRFLKHPEPPSQITV